MKGLFIYIQTNREAWFEDSRDQLETKLSHFGSFEVKAVKSDSSGRADREQKIKTEENKILKFLRPGDLVLAFDESGRTFKNSRGFSQYLVKKIEMGKPRIVFIVGGAFGLGDEVKKRADSTLSLSPLTLNHHLAILVGLEQIYRGLTIWKGIPYHND